MRCTGTVTPHARRALGLLPSTSFPHFLPPQCWLKHQASLPPAERPGGGSSMWTSGVVYPDLGPQADAWLRASGSGSSSSAASPPSSSSSSPFADRNTLTLHFPLGDVAVGLLPDLAPASVRELKRMVQLLEMGGGACDGCRVGTSTGVPGGWGLGRAR